MTKHKSAADDGIYIRVRLCLRPGTLYSSSSGDGNESRKKKGGGVGESTTIRGRYHRYLRLLSLGEFDE